MARILEGVKGPLPPSTGGGGLFSSFLPSVVSFRLGFGVGLGFVLLWASSRLSDRASLGPPSVWGFLGLAGIFILRAILGRFSCRVVLSLIHRAKSRSVGLKMGFMGLL